MYTPKADRVDIAVALVNLQKVSSSVVDLLNRLGVNPELAVIAREGDIMWNVDDTFKLCPQKARFAWKQLSDQLQRVHGELAVTLGQVEIMKQSS